MDSHTDFAHILLRSLQKNTIKFYPKIPRAISLTFHRSYKRPTKIRQPQGRRYVRTVLQIGVEYDDIRLGWRRGGLRRNWSNTRRRNIRLLTGLTQVGHHTQVAAAVITADPWTLTILVHTTFKDADSELADSHVRGLRGSLGFGIFG